MAGTGGYGGYFERDFVSGKDWWRMYEDRPQEMEILGFDMRPTFDKKAGEVERPVMTLRQIGGRHIFVNKTNHGMLLDLFGDEYWEAGPRSAIGKTIMVSCKADSTFRTGPRYQIVIIGKGESTSPIGIDVAQRFMDRLGASNASLGDFLSWLDHVDHDDNVRSVIRGKAIEDWPKTTIRWMGEYARTRLSKQPAEDEQEV